MADRPRPSPSPNADRLVDLEDEAKTDPRILVHDPEALHSYLTKKRAEEHDSFMSKIKALAGAIAVVAGSVVAVILFVDNRVLAQTDAGVKVMTEKHDALKGRVETLEKRFDRFEERTDKQMNLLLDAARVPETKRPPPLEKDGGP